LEIIITDVTDMAGGHICVAGWFPEEGRMVRPLHFNGHPHWDAELAKDDLFSPGNVITVQPSGLGPTRGLPHSTEDLLIIGNPTLHSRMNHNEMAEAVSGSVYGSVRDLFGPTLERKFVPEQTGLRSLGAIELSTSNRMKFYDNGNKVTFWFVDDEDQSYSLTISCRALKKVFFEEGVAGLDRLKSGARKVHVRIGLANPWDGGPSNNYCPKRAYAMVNGLFFV
jgi:hypothetical protein